MEKQQYRVNDLTKAVDRDKTTLLRWEKQGLIPAAKRDSRGWRYYTPDDFSRIVEKIRQSNYFRRAALLPIFALLASGLMTFSLLSFTRYAYGNADLNMNLNIQAGSLSIQASSTVETFSAVNYSFSNQTTTSTNVESVRIQDARGGAGSWTFNVSCQDNTTAGCYWLGATEKDRFQLTADIGGYNIVSDPPSTSGKLCIDFTGGGGYRCASTAGAPCAAVTLTTAYRCFTNKTTDITAATGSAANGDYYLAEWDWGQGIPGRTSASVYTTVITYDLQ
ncbi:MAG: MerR family transcriptional regulator [Patescibacteria group bacterium]|nr:MerR family transcriptional regulator [Patescibacteria group bacterium]